MKRAEAQASKAEHQTNTTYKREHVPPQAESKKQNPLDS